MRDDGIHAGKAMNPGEEISPEEAFERRLDARLVRALGTPPEMTIPADFAARVASRMPVRRRVLLRCVPLRPTHYGRWTLIVSLVVLAVAVVMLGSQRFGHTEMGLTLEWILYAQLVALAIWLGTWRWGLR